MKISILCSDFDHPVFPYLSTWVDTNSDQHELELIEKVRDASGGDILFLVSCSEMVERVEREKYKKVLVLHASDLPRNCGWSPHIWEIIEGAKQVTLSLLEAEDEIDSGAIWNKMRLRIPEHALSSEINEILFSAEIEMIEFALRNFLDISPVVQDVSQVSNYRRRRCADDSQIDPALSIAEQFDLIRVCDPERFPAFFDFRGCRYLLKLEKKDD